MILGKIIGKVSTLKFQFNVTSSKTKKLQFVQVNHPEYGYVLCQIMELERTSEGTTATCNIIGYKSNEGRIKGIRTPFNIGSEVLEAEDEFIKKIVELKSNGAYIGKLEGKNIKVNIDLQKVLTKHLSVLAKSGSGKSYFVGVLLEEIIEKGIPLLIIDPHGEYSSLKEADYNNKEKMMSWDIEPKAYFPKIQEFGDQNNKQDLIPLKLSENMSSYELMKIIPTQLSNTQESMLFSVIKDLDEINFDNILINLELLNYPGKWSLMDTIMYLKGLNLFSHQSTKPNELVQIGKCSILNLKGISPEVQDIIVYKIMKDIFNARKREQIPPFFCVIEEAHNFAPEKGFGKSKSTETIRLISSEGRKFGLGLCVVSQRPALVQKTILAQCSTQVILKLTNPNDLRAVSNSIEGISSETVDEIQNLSIGTGLVCGVVDKPLIVNVRPRRTKHGGEAVNILQNIEKSLNKEEEKDGENKVVRRNKENVQEKHSEDKIFNKLDNFKKEEILPLIKPKLSINDIKLISNKPIKFIKNYLIPAVLFECQDKINENNINNTHNNKNNSNNNNKETFFFLIDKVKSNIIIDPDENKKVDISDISSEHNFNRKIVFESITNSEKINEKFSTEQIKSILNQTYNINSYQVCYIVYRKISYRII